MADLQTQDDVALLLPARKGHFRLESGHHGELWLELERLCVRPKSIERLAAILAERLSLYHIEAVCGPLVEGAFVALMVASTLDVPFTYSEPHEDTGTDALFPVQYHLPGGLREQVRGRRLAIVNDVINAGSAVRGTMTDLLDCGALVITIGTLAVLGQTAATYAAEKNVALETLAWFPNEIWTAAECPLCARGVPLTNACA
jgi:orotate phosphoribosyltransferase